MNFLKRLFGFGAQPVAPICLHQWNRCSCEHCGTGKPNDSPDHNWDRCVCQTCRTKRYQEDSIDEHHYCVEETSTITYPGRWETNSTDFTANLQAGPRSPRRPL